MRPLVKELGGIGHPLHMLSGKPRYHSRGQVIEKPGTDALGYKAAFGSALDRIRRWWQEVGREGRCGALDVIGLDATGSLEPQLLRQLQFLEHEAGETFRIGGIEQYPIPTGCLEITIGPLNPDGAAQHAQCGGYRLMLGLNAG